jgi:hypothetical protein
MITFSVHAHSDSFNNGMYNTAQNIWAIRESYSIKKFYEIVPFFCLLCISCY